MRTLLAAMLGASLLAAAAPAGATASSVERRAAAAEPFRVLVYSRTTGFRHVSIPFGIAAIQRLGREHGFAVDATEDPAAFTAANLRRYAAVIFLNTTGTILGDPQKRAFEEYIEAGGGFAGVHSAADTEYDWAFYGRLIGTYFSNHPLQQFAEFVREAADHPATAHLPERFRVFDEFYSFRRNPRPDVRVLLSIDESTYSPDPNTSHLPGGTPTTGVMGDHPMSWCQPVGRGRSFYTALGHEIHLYFEDWYLRHLLGGIRTAAGRVAADCGDAEDAEPQLRLTRRCLGDGRLDMALAGDVEAVRDVNFKLGRRLARRDTEAPFEQVLDRRTLKRTDARRLRAVAYLHDGGPQRAILSRSLPRCGLR